MGTLKKYSKERLEWYPVASDLASCISTSLLDEQGNRKNVDEALTENRQEIDLLKKNVSWLALHGGGGSGYGGGTNVPNFEIYFTDVYGNKFDENTMILSLSEQQLTINYTILCNKSLMFTVLLLRDGRLILTYKNIKADGYTKTVSISNVNKNTTLKLVAIYGINTADETKNSNTDNFLNITLSAINIEKGLYLTVTKNLLLNSVNKFPIKFTTTLGGDYVLYWNKNTFTTYDVENLDTRVLIMGVPSGLNTYYFDIANLSDLNSNTLTGTYPYYFMLVREESGTTGKLYSLILTCSINVVETEGILITLLSDDIVNSSLNQSNLCRFITFFGSDLFSSYQYTLSYAPAGEEPYPENYEGFTTFFGNDPNNSNLYAFRKEQQYELVPSNIGISSVSGDVDKYIIRIRAFVGPHSTYKDFVLNVSQSDTNYLKKYEEYLSNDTIFKYEFWDIASSGNDTLFTLTCLVKRGLTINVDSKISINNKGIDSGLSESGYMFRHLAHANITVPNNTIFPKNGLTDSDSLIIASAGFSIELSYRIGREISDDVTIFRLGDYNPVNKTGKGIVIKAHEYYINFGGESNLRGVLEDNTFNQLNIVVLPTKNSNNANSMDIQLYLNGKAFAIARGITYTNFTFSSNPQICLAYDGNDLTLVSTYANVKFYSVKMYAKALNVGLIVCSYINNYINDQRIGGQINSSLLNTLLENNSINSDDLVEHSDVPICSIYDIENSKYTIKEYLDLHASRDKAVLPTSLLNLPIPKVVLHTSDPNWTFGNFKSQGVAIEADTQCTFEYYKEDETESIFFGDNLASVTVGILGTTTAGYNIKNVDITFNNNILFSPREDWYPENYFVLKADVVDSGHINNAVIGKFINTCYNDLNSLIDLTAFPAKEHIENNFNQNYVLPDTFTTKACIEGFPILLIIDFSSESGSLNRDYQVLGIYSFNLGRNSIYNQGFEILKRLRDYNNGNVISSPNSISFPAFFGSPLLEDTDNVFKAYCYEGEAVINNLLQEVDINSSTYFLADIKVNDSEKYTFKNVGKNSSGKVTVNDLVFLSKEGNTVPYDSSHVQKYNIKYCGYFWSDNESYWLNLFKEVYTGGDSTNVASNNFASFCRLIALNVPYLDNAGIVVGDGTSYLKYRVAKSDSDTYNIEALPGEEVKIALPQTLQSPSFSVRNVAFYYVVAMLFGLIDNLGKNMQFKKWINKLSGTEYSWSPTFYDMDTALKLDNSGIETYSPDVFDCTFINNPNNLMSSVYGTGLLCDYSDKTYRVHSNKLFGIDNDVFLDKWSSEYTKSSENGLNMYSAMWLDIRTKYIPDVDKFVDDYFELQLHKCGELIFNLDYEMKYINTTLYNMLHGDRLGTIRNWLKERVIFLDSVFLYKANKGTNFYKETYLRGIKYNVPVNDKVHITFENGNNPLMTTFNTSCIVTSTYDNNYDYITYAEKKKPTSIIMSLSGVGGLLYVNNSSCIVDIDNLNEVGLKEISATATHSDVTYNETYSHGTLLGSLSSLLSFDIRNASGISNEGINFGLLFATWNRRYVDGTDPDSFGLRDINLSGVKAGIGNLNVNLNINNSDYSGIKVFENITNIDVSNSDVSAVAIPSGVSLNTLIIKGSVISELDLNGQPLLQEIDFTGCSALETVRISNCSAILALEFKTDNTNLKTIEIAGCDNLVSFKVTGNKDFRYNPTIRLERCSNLQTIEIKQCCSSSDVNLSDLTISECYKVKTINLSGSFIDSVYLDKGIGNADSSLKITSLTKLDLSSSKVRVLKHNNSNTDTIDLTSINSISTLSLRNNKDVQYVKINNILNSPFDINTSYCFAECDNLERVYGNLRIKNSACFYKSLNFSVLGENTTSYNGVNMRPGNNYLHFADIQQTINNGKPIFLSGESATNIELYNSNCSSSFNSTNCTILDVYYILYNISSTVRNINSLFYDCSNLGNDSYGWINEERSINRHIFDKCQNITSIATMFYGCGIKNIILYSPTYSEGDYKDNGLFSNLLNCTDAHAMFGTSYNYGFRADKNLFRLSSNKKFKFTDLSATLGINKIVEDTNAITLTENGDLTDFFEDLEEIQHIDLCFGGVNLIKYDTINIKNTKITDLYFVFNSSSGNGDIIFDDIFNKNLRILSSSFRITGSGSKPTLNINNSMFEGFNKIEGIGYVPINDYYSNVLLSIRNSSFEGVNKIIDGNSFPYNLLNPIKNTIKHFTGFFNNAGFTDTTITVDLPGTLFEECINLVDIHNTFYNFRNKYQLTSDGFLDCKKLSNVSNLFASSISTIGGHKLIGSIPNNLFHIGGNYKTIEYLGITWNSSDPTHNLTVLSVNGNVATVVNGLTTITYRNFDRINNTTIRRRPDTKITTTTKLSVYNEESGLYEDVYVSTEVYYGNEIGLDLQLNTTTIVYEEIIKSISDISHCFQGASISPYENEDINVNDRILLSTYQPYDYICESGGVWKKVTNKNTNRYSLMDVFDGVNYPNNANSSDGYEILDVPCSALSDLKYVRFTTGKLECGEYSANYCCAPDLLKWCSISCNVEGLFKNCGVTSTGLTTSFDGSNYTTGIINEVKKTFGLKGRIPPYLFKHTPKVPNLKEVFYGCHLLDAYKDLLNNVRIIPLQLLTYVSTSTLSLENMFSGIHFPKNISLSSVFNNRTSYNIKGIFKYCKYLGDSSSNSDNSNPVIIENVFNGLKFSNVDEAFLCMDYAQTTGHSWPRTGVQFSNNFINAKFTSSDYIPKRVYYAYLSSVTKPVNTETLISNNPIYENYTDAF